jgi:hypothetical protein
MGTEEISEMWWMMDKVQNKMLSNVLRHHQNVLIVIEQNNDFYLKVKKVVI